MLSARQLNTPVCYVLFRLMNIGKVFPVLLLLLSAATNAAVSTTPQDPTLTNRGFEGIHYDAKEINAIKQAYGVKTPLLQFYCGIPIKRSISDASACRVRCSDQGENIVDVFAIDSLLSGKTASGKELLIISRTENHDGVQENGGVVLLNTSASCFFQGMKVAP